MSSFLAHPSPFPKPRKRLCFKTATTVWTSELRGRPMSCRFFFSSHLLDNSLQPQCHKLQKKRFETSRDQHWLTVTARFYHCLVHFSNVPAKQCWPRPRGETDMLAGIQIRPVPAAHSHIAFSPSTSRHPFRSSWPTHHMLSGKALSPSSGWGGHGPPIPWSRRPGSSPAA